MPKITQAMCLGCSRRMSVCDDEPSANELCVKRKRLEHALERAKEKLRSTSAAMMRGTFSWALLEQRQATALAAQGVEDQLTALAPPTVRPLVTAMCGALRIIGGLPPGRQWMLRFDVQRLRVQAEDLDAARGRALDARDRGQPPPGYDLFHDDGDRDDGETGWREPECVGWYFTDDASEVGNDDAPLLTDDAALQAAWAHFDAEVGNREAALVEAARRVGLLLGPVAPEVL